MCLPDRKRYCKSGVISKKRKTTRCLLGITVATVFALTGNVNAFESGALTCWDSAGAASVIGSMTDLPNSYPPDVGSFQAQLITAPGATPSSLAAFMGSDEVTLGNLIGDGGLSEGSAIRQNIYGHNGDTLTFRYRFLTGEDTGGGNTGECATYTDGAFVVIDGNAQALPGANAGLICNNDDSAPGYYDNLTGWMTFTYNFTSDGSVLLAIGVANEEDTAVDSVLLVDNVRLNGTTIGGCPVTFGDFVWDDLDHDGVQDGGEPGLSGVQVDLYSSPGNVLLGTDTTDGSGAYSISSGLLPASPDPANFYLEFTNLPTGYTFSPQFVGASATDSNVNPGTGRATLNGIALGTVDNTVDAGASDATPPTVISINRQNPVGNPTTNTTVTWRVVFSEAVQVGSVQVGDFTLVDVSNTITGETVSLVNQVNATTWDVTATMTPGTYTGTLRLDVIGTTATILDIPGNDITADFTTGQTYTIDRSTITPTVDMTAATDLGSSNTDNVTSDNTPTFTGPGENGATVTLSTNNPATPNIGSAVVSGGVWTITVSTLIDGTHTITATAVDTLGNSASANLTPVVIDTGLPNFPTLDLQAASDSGSSNTDNITNDTTPTFDITADSGNTVTLTSNISGSLGSSFVSTGSDTFTANAMPDGIHTITVRATDTAGNFRETTLIVRIDTAPPTITSINRFNPATSPTAASTLIWRITFNEAVQSGTVNTADFTLVDVGASITGESITGTATVNSSVYSITVNSGTGDGTLRLDANVGPANFADIAGNVIVAGASGQSYVLDRSTPQPTIDLQAASDLGISNTDNYTSDNTPTFDGTAESGATVVLTSNIQGGTLASTTATGGTWTATTLGLIDGVHIITVTSTDALGNVNTNTLTVTIDTTLPPFPTINLQAASDSGASNTDDITNAVTPIFDGTAEAGTTLQLTSSLDGPLSNPSSAGGTWNSGVGLSEGTHTMTIRSTDDAGNFREGTMVVVIDRTAPNPTIARFSPAGPATNAGSVTWELTFDGNVGGLTNLTNFALVQGGGVSGASLTGGLTTINPSTYRISANTGSGDGTLGLNMNDNPQTILDVAGNAYSGTEVGEVYTIDKSTPNPTIDLTAGSDTGTSNTDDLTNDTTPTFTGTAEPGSTIQLVSDLDGPMGSTTVTGGGTWTLTTSPALTTSGSHTITVIVTDPLGNVNNTITFTLDLDLIPPTTPTISMTAATDSGVSNSDAITQDTTPDFTGSADNGNGITLSSNVNGPIGIDTSTGTWLITSSALNEGPHTITVTATDDAGNTASNNLAAQIDNTPPTVVINRFDPVGSITTQQALTWRATFNEPVSQVDLGDFQLVEAGGVTGSSLTSYTPFSQSVYNILTDRGANDGTLQLNLPFPGAFVSDLAGNFLNTGATGQIYTIDSTPPPPPSDPNLVDTSDTGFSFTDDITADNTPQFDGTADPNVQIEVFADNGVDPPISLGLTTTNGAGQWALTSGPVLADGNYDIYVIATDAGFNTTASGVTPIVIDTVALVPGIDLNALTDTGFSNSDDITTDTTPTFDGTGEDGALIVLTSAIDGFLGSTIVASGSWQITTGRESEGTFFIVVTMTDVAGNTNTNQIEITIDRTKPEVTSILRNTPLGPETNAASVVWRVTFTEDIDPTSLSAADFALVDIGNWITGESITGVSQVNGNTFDVTVNTGTGDGQLQLNVNFPGSSILDIAGNGLVVAATGEIYIIDKTTVQPTIDLDAASDSGSSNTDDITNDDFPTFNGTAEVNASIVLTSDVFGGIIGTGTADGSGNWTITSTVDLIDALHTITVTSTDPVGNTNNNSMTVTIDTVTPPPTLDMVNASDTGSSNTDNLTYDTTPTFDGTAENGATVVLSSNVNGGPMSTSPSTGTWTGTSSITLDEGPHTITATATDIAGNTNTGTLDIEIDITPPTATASRFTPLTTPTNLGTVVWRVVFSEDIEPTSVSTSDFTLVDVGNTITGEAITGVAQVNSTTYDVTVNTGTGDGDLRLDIQVLFAAIFDIAGNDLTPSTTGETYAIDKSTPPPTPNLVDASDSGTFNNDDYTNDNTPTLDGPGEVGATIDLRSDLVNGGATSIGSGIVTAGSTWQITTILLPDGVHTITATATDALGNTNTAQIVITVDTVTPQPTLNLVDASDSGTFNNDDYTNDNTPTMDGTAEANANITVSSNHDGTIYTTSANGAGVFSSTSGITMTDDVHIMTVTSVDLAGNIGTNTLNITIDTVTPQPTINLVDASDSGSSNTDDYTNDNTPTFDGTAESGADIVLSTNLPGPLTIVTTTAPGGVYNGTSGPTMVDGVHTVTVTATDLAGNTNNNSMTVTIDTTINPPTINLVDASDSGSSNTDDYTNDNTPTFDGTAEAGATVDLSSDLDGALVSSTAPGGNYNATSTITVVDGVHTVTVLATDQAGNTASAFMTVTIDTTTPVPTIDLSAGSDSGFSNTDNITNVQAPTFNGTGEINSVVTVVSSISGTIGTSPTTAGATWTHTTAGPVVPLSDGDHSFTVSIVDLAGNTNVSAPLVVTIDTVTPDELCGGEISVLGASITSLPTAIMIVTFNEPVYNVTAGLFSISGPGTITGVTPLSGFEPDDAFLIDVASSGLGDVTVAYGTPGSILDQAGNPYPNTNNSSAVVTFVDASATQVGNDLAPADSVLNDRYGAAIAIESETIMVGAPTDDNLANNAGVVFVYTRDNTSSFTESQILTAPTGAEFDRFGEAIAIDGDWAVIGAPYNDTGDADSGSAYIYHRNSTSGLWEFHTELFPTIQGNSFRFGNAVAINSGTIAIGAPLGYIIPDGVYRSGVVYLYEYDGCSDTWFQVQILEADDANHHDEFGSAVALVGSRLLVGAPLDDDSGSSTGSVYVYVFFGGTWTQFSKLSAPAAARFDYFGRSIAMDETGQYAVIGAPGTDYNGIINSGVAFAFQRQGPFNWTSTDMLHADDPGTADGFGWSVDISGEIIAVGSDHDDDPILDQGSAYVFTGGPFSYSQFRKLLSTTPDRYDYYGTAVGVSGETVVVGAPFANNVERGLIGSVSVGRAHVYRTDQ